MYAVLHVTRVDDMWAYLVQVNLVKMKSVRCSPSSYLRLVTVLLIHSSNAQKEPPTRVTKNSRKELNLTLLLNDLFICSILCQV